MLNEKVKLKLYPVDDVTLEILLEMGYKAGLELTLSKSKPLRKIIDHLTNKWRDVMRVLHNDAVLELYPFQNPRDIAWNEVSDENISALDILQYTGKTAGEFRLRVGWVPIQRANDALTFNIFNMN